MITDKKINRIAEFYVFRSKSGIEISNEVKRQLVRIITQKNNP